MKILKNISMIQHRITDKFVWKASISKITNKDFSILHNRFCDYTLLIFNNFTSLLLYKTFHGCSGLSHRHLTFHLCTYNNALTNAQSWLLEICVALVDIMVGVCSLAWRKRRAFYWFFWTGFPLLTFLGWKVEFFLKF